jgi:hypothetical protein
MILAQRDLRNGVLTRDGFRRSVFADEEGDPDETMNRARALMGLGPIGGVGTGASGERAPEAEDAVSWAPFVLTGA